VDSNSVASRGVRGEGSPRGTRVTSERGYDIRGGYDVKESKTSEGLWHQRRYNVRGGMTSEGVWQGAWCRAESGSPPTSLPPI